MHTCVNTFNLKVGKHQIEHEFTFDNKIKANAQKAVSSFQNSTILNVCVNIS